VSNVKNVMKSAKVIVDTESVSDGGYSDDRRGSREKVYRSSVTSGKPMKYSRAQFCLRLCFPSYDFFLVAMS